MYGLVPLLILIYLIVFLMLGIVVKYKNNKKIIKYLIVTTFVLSFISIAFFQLFIVGISLIALFIIPLMLSILAYILFLVYDRFGRGWTLVVVFLCLFLFLALFLKEGTVNVYTDKREYCIGEPVEIYISKGVLSADSGCKLRFIKRRSYHDGATYHDDGAYGYVEETARNYQKRIDIFWGTTETIVWDQNDPKNEEKPTVPGDYFVFITCMVGNPMGWGGYEKTADFSIRECNISK